MPRCIHLARKRGFVVNQHTRTDSLENQLLLGALLRSRGSDRQRSYAPVILLLPNLKSRHRLTDAWPADCAYLLSAVDRIAYSQTLP